MSSLAAGASATAAAAAGLPGPHARGWLSARALLAWLLLGCIAINLALFAVPRSNGQLVASDGVEFYIYLRSLAIDHDLDFANEYAHFHRHGGYPTPALSAAGRIANKHAAVGVALLWAPFFLAAHALALLLQAAGVGVAADGYHPLYQAAVCFASAVYGALACALGYRAARRYYPAWPSALAAAVLWLASNAFYYMTVEPTMSHMLSAFAVAAALSVWLLKLRDAPRPALRDFALLGLAGGLVMTVRTQDTVFLAIPLVFMALRWGQCLRAPGRAGLAHWSAGLLVAGAAALALLALQLHTWHAIYGVWSESPMQRDPMQHDQAAQVFRWGAPKIGSVLFSGFHGLFSWHPVTLVATLGLGLLWRRDAALAALLLACFGIQVYIVAAWYGWSQGDAFGGRVFLNCVWLWVLGLAAVFAWVGTQRRWTRAAAAALAGLLIAWNALSFAQYGLNLISHSVQPSLRELTIGRLLLPQQLLGLLLQRIEAPRPRFRRATRNAAGSVGTACTVADRSTRTAAASAAPPIGSGIDCTARD